MTRTEAPEQTRDSEALASILDQVQRRLLAEINPTTDMSSREQVLPTLDGIFNEVVRDSKVPLSRAEREEMRNAIIANILGYGPLEALLADDSVTEILVNGPSQVYVERRGRMMETDITFRSNADLMRIVDRIVTPLGRRVDESSPMVDARLPDGSRVNVIAPPLAIDGTALTIRKFKKDKLTLSQLVKFGSISPDGAEVLRILGRVRANVLISGGTGSGKTTLLNCLTGFIEKDERVITCEDSAELQLQQPHVAEWWDDDATETLGGVEAMYGERVAGTSVVTPWVMEIEGSAVGFIQWYRVEDEADWYPGVAIPPGTVALDVAIGDPAYVGQGHGRRLVRHRRTGGGDQHQRGADARRRQAAGRPRHRGRCLQVSRPQNPKASRITWKTQFCSIVPRTR
mgnify:CR=1 FL=1